jgi:cation diffusion facilitator CzcD-associated flavoprotein CzcO
MWHALQSDQRLIEALVPNFPYGCRRITPAVGYLESLAKGNVQVITDGIAQIQPDGLTTVTGEHTKVDAIICATGFDLSFAPRFPIIGRDGNLQDIWKKNLPRAYMSCAVEDMPNFFSEYFDHISVGRV